MAITIANNWGLASLFSAYSSDACVTIIYPWLAKKQIEVAVYGLPGPGVRDDSNRFRSVTRE